MQSTSCFNCIDRPLNARPAAVSPATFLPLGPAEVLGFSEIFSTVRSFISSRLNRRLGCRQKLKAGSCACARRFFLHHKRRLTSNLTRQSRALFRIFSIIPVRIISGILMTCRSCRYLTFMRAPWQCIGQQTPRACHTRCISVCCGLCLLILAKLPVGCMVTS